VATITILPLPFYQIDTISYNNQAVILGGIGSIYVAVFGILQIVNNFLTKNSEDVVMANKLYKVEKKTAAQSGGSEKQQVVNTMQARENFTFTSGLQFKKRTFGCCFKKDVKFQQLGNAQKSLYEEMEITNILKMLRLA
jgi:hypothetical protein